MCGFSLNDTFKKFQCEEISVNSSEQEWWFESAWNQNSLLKCCKKWQLILLLANVHLSLKFLAQKFFPHKIFHFPQKLRNLVQLHLNFEQAHTWLRAQASDLLILSFFARLFCKDQILTDRAILSSVDTFSIKRNYKHITFCFAFFKIPVKKLWFYCC